MKRFYCTICTRTIRVRKYPTNVQNTSSEQVTDRTGSCNWHDVTRTGTPIIKAEHRAAFAALSMKKGGR